MIDKNTKKWRFGIDRGGTFTDIIGFSPDDKIHTKKVLSESEAYDDAGVEGIRQFLELDPDEKLPADKIEWIRMGTTVATNALLERKGKPTGLLITKGFRDVLEIGTQDRPDLFALAIKKPELIYQSVAEVNERMAYDGSVITELDKKSLKKGLEHLKNSGAESLAIVFLFSWKNSEHEKIAYDMAKEMGFMHISTSHETMPVIQIVGRGRTTLVDAYLTPVLLNYAERIRKWTGSIPLYFMSSTGSLMSSDGFSGKDAILSGPAGGVLGVSSVSRTCEDDAVIGFDMGGTSTDVCRYAGTYERVLEVETAGIRFTTPMLEIETVAAGGGSILSFDGRKLNVGPESAGANPGPACYGLGGPLAVTDANLILGRLQPKYFPKVFGKNRNSSLNIEASRKRFAEIAEEIFSTQDIKMNVEELALGFLKVAVETMSRPIKQLSVAKGHDPREHALVCFGGAGSQHACAIARSLDIKTIRIPPFASLLSAYGIFCAPLRRNKVESVLLELNENNLSEIKRLANEMLDECQEKLETDIISSSNFEILNKIELDLRIPGTDSPLTIEFKDTIENTISEFQKDHNRHYGFKPPEVIPEVVNIRTEVFEKYEPAYILSDNENVKEACQPAETVMTWFEGYDAIETPVYLRDKLHVGQIIKGPALITERHSSVVVEPGFEAFLEKSGVLTIVMIEKFAEKTSTECDPVLLEVFHHLFMGVAGQMGDVLRRTAHSVNIKERLDFSCAVFDGNGNLVANAPHIPVHLGAMSETVRHLIQDVGEMVRPGDFYCSNDPYAGGSHLPDITVMTPVFRDEKPLFYLAARGHHADIGGIVPGSIPPFAESLIDEGVVLKNLLIVSKGKFKEDEINKALNNAEYPARNIPERLSDLRAQIAAVKKGILELERICAQYGDDVVDAYMKHIRNDAQASLEEALEKFLEEKQEKTFNFEDALDSGTKIKVKIRIYKTETGKVRASIDFEGTGEQTKSNLNAPPAVTRAAVLYVLRTLIEKNIPLNDGCLEPVEISIPEKSIINPEPGRAVSGGNVETSQRIVDTLYGALGIAAASQGTMNNVLFGSPDNEGAQYYETIAGGSGATANSPGASAFQVHMTNTRITDAEVLETRFPKVRLERFVIRKQSGGNGNQNGGDGVIRSYKFLTPHAVSILSERRVKQPFGLNGGQNGLAGKNSLIKADGTIVELGSHFQGVTDPGDILEIQTPGGGAFGKND